MHPPAVQCISPIHRKYMCTIHIYTLYGVHTCCMCKVLSLVCFCAMHCNNSAQHHPPYLSKYLHCSLQNSELWAAYRSPPIRPSPSFKLFLRAFVQGTALDGLVLHGYEHQPCQLPARKLHDLASAALPVGNKSPKSPFLFFPCSAERSSI